MSMTAHDSCNENQPSTAPTSHQRCLTACCICVPHYFLRLHCSRIYELLVYMYEVSKCACNYVVICLALSKPKNIRNAFVAAPSKTKKYTYLHILMSILRNVHTYIGVHIRICNLACTKRCSEVWRGAWRCGKLHRFVFVTAAISSWWPVTHSTAGSLLSEASSAACY